MSQSSRIHYILSQANKIIASGKYSSGVVGKARRVVMAVRSNAEYGTIERLYIELQFAIVDRMMGTQ